MTNKMVEGIQKEIEEKIWNGTYSVYKKGKLIAALVHELGHLYFALVQHFTFISLRIDKYFIVPHKDTAFRVLSIEEIAKKDDTIKALYQEVLDEKGLGECYIYQGEKRTNKELADEYKVTLKGGPLGTASLARVDRLKDIGFFKRQWLLLDTRSNNPTEDNKLWYWFCLSSLSSARNDQKLARELDTAPEEAVKLNDRFCKVAQGNVSKDDAPKDRLHAALIDYAKKTPL